jgi:hypothetical protein
VGFELRRHSFDELGRRDRLRRRADDHSGLQLVGQLCEEIARLLAAEPVAELLEDNDGGPFSLGAVRGAGPLLDKVDERVVLQLGTSTYPRMLGFRR